MGFDLYAKYFRFVSCRLRFQLPWLGSAFLSSVLLVGSSVQASPWLGFHLEAQSQPTPWGKTLHTLHLDGEQLYMGYGDYSKNTGPIAIRSYDIAKGAFSPSRLMARTEAISQWRSWGGRVFGLMTDASFGPSQGGYFSGSASETWSETLIGKAIHSYDIARYNGELYVAGAGSSNASGYAAIHQSRDGGITWRIDLEVPPPVGGYGRFYGIHGLGGRLYAFATEFVGETSTFSVYQNSGKGWVELRFKPGASSAIAGAPMLDLVSLNDVIIGRTNHAGLALGRMHAFDGARWFEVFGPPDRSRQAVLTYDHTVADGALYVLTRDFRIAKTTDLKTWRDVVVGVTSYARSLAVVDDSEIYVGGVNGGLYRYGSGLKP